MLSDTKIDDSFPKGQFLIKGFGDPFRIDRNVNGGRILFYVGEDLPENWSQYDNIIIVGYSLSSLIKALTRYKNSTSPSCIDLTSTNSHLSFQNSSVAETSLSDFHRIFANVLKTTFQRLLPKIKNYSDYSNFVNGMFPTCLCNDLLKDVEKIEKCIKVCINTLNNHVPSKRKYTRCNNLPFMNKELCKSKMNRARLRSAYLRKRSDKNRKKYSKQWNYCVLLLRWTKSKY